MLANGQLNMFESTGGECVPLLEHLNHGMQERGMYELSEVSGLYYFAEFLDDDAQRKLVGLINAGQWREDLERRVQHYGWRYDYRARAVTLDMDLGPLPEWVAAVAARLYAETQLFDRIPDQAIVNEYQPGQGIALHADRDCFGATVATVSLCDAWEMKLRPIGGTSREDQRVLLERGSALVLTGESRTAWMHGIDKRRREKGSLRHRERHRRLSLTFRTFVASGEAWGT